MRSAPSLMTVSCSMPSEVATVILLLLLIGSCMMISLGIIGIYIARIYDEVKARPRYLISGRTEENDEDEKDGIQFRSQKYTKTI